MSRKYVTSVYHENDVYEVTVDGAMIVQVIKYLGESQTPRFLSFDELSPSAKHAILERIGDEDE